MVNDREIIDDAILAMRERGMTRKAIGELLNLPIYAIKLREVRAFKRRRRLKERLLNPDDIYSLDLSTRANVCLRNANICTISQLRDVLENNSRYLVTVRGLGLKTFIELQEAVK